MKFILCFIISIFLVTSFGCNSNSQSNSKNNQSSTSDSTLVNENEGNKINYDSTKVLKSVYVIDRNGAEIKQQATQNSKTLGTFEYGTELSVIEETKDWVGVMDRITRVIEKTDEIIESTGWEKVYVLKSKTGSLNEITLIPSDLNIISSLTRNQNSEFYEKGKELKGFLKIELIDKSLFESKRSSAVNFLLADTTEIKKKNGILELKCLEKTKKFKDKPNDEESMQLFDYVGQYVFLNQYLIAGSYYEEGDYSFIDKNNCEETQSFVDFPYISADKKHIISIYSNPYESTADLELYSIDNKQIKPVMRASFVNWMPTIEPGEMFWSTDGYFYITANHIKSFWKEDGNLSDKYQYIRIKVL